MIGTPDLQISEAFVAILLLKSLPPRYSAIVQTTLASFELIKLARIYTILAMEANRSAISTHPSDTALAASSSSSQGRYPAKKPKDKDTRCSLGHSGHTDEHCKVRRFREMEKDLAELKKERGTKKEQAQLATTGTTSDYWELAFSCQTSTTSSSDVADTGSSSHMFHDKSRFNHIRPSSPVHIMVASADGSITATERGQVSVGDVTLTNVIHSDKLSSNLISIGKLCDEMRAT